MIRIGFVLPHLRPGGAERCVVNWIGALDRRRFAPYLFLKSVEGGFLDLLPPDVTPVALGGARAMRLPRAIAAALDAHAIDTAYSATNAINLALLAAPTRARRIVSEHTPPRAYLAEAKLAPLRRLAMRRLYARADAVAVPTGRIAADLHALFGDRLKTVVLPNPVVDSLAPPANRAPATPPRIVSAGRLVPAKGFDTLIDAAAALAAQGRDFHLDILGDGALRNDLAGRIAAAGLADRIVLHGAGDLPAALAAADLFVLASRREGFGNVLVEAMAANVPVVATRAGGPETFVTHGVNGWLAPPDDAVALAAMIAAALVSPDRARIVAAGRKTAAGYSIAAATAAFAALVTELAQDSVNGGLRLKLRAVG